METFTTQFLSDNMTQPLHPYYPLHIYFAEYQPNEWSVAVLLTIFFGTCAALSWSTHSILKTNFPKLSKAELFATNWFVLSGCIHLFFEGYYAINFDTLATKQTVLGQLWKEYAFSDSRYLTNDSFVLCMESATAFLWGPACLAVAAMIVYGHPTRHALQILVSTGQLYGDILYFATCAFHHWDTGFSYSRPELFRFWFYFVFMNFIWIVIPGYLIYQSFVAITKATNKSRQQVPRKGDLDSQYSARIR